MFDCPPWEDLMPEGYEECCSCGWEVDDPYEEVGPEDFEEEDSD